MTDRTLSFPPPNEQGYPPVEAVTPRADDQDGEAPVAEVREAHDASDHDVLLDNPSDEDAVADIAGDESFPASDPPSHAPQGSGEPAPSSGYDADAEQAIAEKTAQVRERAFALWEAEGRPDGQHLDHWARARHDLDRPGADDMEQ